MARLELVRTKGQIVKITEEYYNSIRTNIQFSGKGLKTIVITSVQPGEGKSTTSVNLAISFAKTGYKTLLIDADTRNSVLSGTFKADGSYKGLTHFLSGHTELPEIICETSVDNLAVIPSGPVPPNPTTLLQNNYFDTMMDLMKQIYDYIIIDTPPIGLVIDAALIAQKADASILVTEAGAVKRHFIKKAREQMEQSGTPFLGIILNKVGSTVDSYGSYGSYGEYGKKETKSKRRRTRK